MRLVKEMTIAEMSGTHYINAPIRIITKNRTQSFANKKSSLSLDVKTCERFGIPLSINNACRTLVCTLESYEPQLREPRFAFVDHQQITADDVNIVNFSRKERYRFLSCAPPQRYKEVSCSLNLESFGGDDGTHPHPHPHTPPCPFYKLEIDLTEEEYKQCLELAPASIFRVSFAMKQDERSCWPPKTMKEIQAEMQAERGRK